MESAVHQFCPSERATVAAWDGWSGYTVHGGRVLPPHILPASLLLFPKSSVLGVGVQCVRTLVGGLLLPVILSGQPGLLLTEEHLSLSHASLCQRKIMLKQSRASYHFACGGAG